MTISRITAQVDSESVTQNRVFVREPYLLIYGALADQDSWLRVIRDARCAGAAWSRPNAALRRSRWPA
jgi:hypothetical protein